MGPCAKMKLKSPLRLNHLLDNTMNNNRLPAVVSILKTPLAIGKTNRSYLRPMFRQAVGLLELVAAWSLSGLSATEAQVNLQTMSGWKAFAVVTQGDDISFIADPGYGNIASRGTYDGLGAYRAGANLSIWMNHETSTAAISRIDVDINNFRQAIQSVVDNGQTEFPPFLKTGMGYAYDRIFDGTYHAVNNPDPVASGTVGVGNYGDANFDRFCAGTSHPAYAFGGNRGFADDLYLTGEEVSGGKFYALDERTRTLWEATDLGLGQWENAALVDTHNTTHIALVMNSDSGSGLGEPIRLYIGEKSIDVNGDGEIDFLERNGLRGGSVYYFAPDKGFSHTDLPSGQVTGKWTSNLSDALTETKLEDIHTNPNNGNELVFADQTDGVYRMDVDLVFDGNDLDLMASAVLINQIDDVSTPPVGAPDNVTWSLDGRIYVEEDGDGNGIFHMAPDGTGLTQIAVAFSEPSGIIDFSEFVGYEPGSIFLTSVQGNGASGAQLITLISPEATRSVIDAQSFKIIRGLHVGGELSDVNFSDDSYLQFRPGLTVNASEPPVWLEFTGTLPSDNPASLSFALEAKGNTVGLLQTIEMYDFDTGDFEEIDSRAATTSDTVVQILAPGDQQRFVESGSGIVKTRLAWRAQGPVVLYPWTVSLDQVIWTVNR